MIHVDFITWPSPAGCTMGSGSFGSVPAEEARGPADAGHGHGRHRVEMRADTVRWLGRLQPFQIFWDIWYYLIISDYIWLYHIFFYFVKRVESIFTSLQFRQILNKNNVQSSNKKEMIRLVTHSFGQAAGRGYQPGRGSEGSMDFPDILAIGNEDLLVFFQDFPSVDMSFDMNFHQLDLVISGASWWKFMLWFMNIKMICHGDRPVFQPTGCCSFSLDWSEHSKRRSLGMLEKNCLRLVQGREVESLSRVELQTAGFQENVFKPGITVALSHKCKG